ncbi:MAG: phosphoenolpyruvate carboxykinase (GTP), partial [Victivallales bacterium]|nr:phosphoenolpyruvate carboxykinase (GTP) [Victivallales bacterium]
DPEWDKPEGQVMDGIIYGGRDSDTNAPVREAYSWEHGVCTMGAMLESETTSATIGAEGVRKWNVMSNMDFLSMSVGRYIQNNLDFAKDIERPNVFGTNYFLKKDGQYTNGKLDKSIWVKWMELRAHGEVDAIDAAYGMIPKYEDLAKLFKQVLDEDYSKEDYAFQFRVNIPELLAKLGRMEEIYSTKVTDTPEVMKAEMKAQRERLEALKAAKGEYVCPFDLD